MVEKHEISLRNETVSYGMIDETINVKIYQYPTMSNMYVAICQLLILHCGNCNGINAGYVKMKCTHLYSVFP